MVAMQSMGKLEVAGLRAAYEGWSAAHASSEGQW